MIFIISIFFCAAAIISQLVWVAIAVLVVFLIGVGTLFLAVLFIVWNARIAHRALHQQARHRFERATLELQS